MAVDRKQQMKEITERLEQGVKDILHRKCTRRICARWQNSTITASIIRC